MGSSNSAIEVLLSAWQKAIASSDLDAIAEMVTEDAEFWSNGRAPLIGRQSVKDAFRPVFDSYTMSQEFRCDELVVADDLAFMRGLEVNRLVSRDTGQETTVHQRAFSVMRRSADGSWRFSRGMTNQPPEEP